MEDILPKLGGLDGSVVMRGFPERIVDNSKGAWM
jgi:hypothetical protein